MNGESPVSRDALPYPYPCRDIAALYTDGGMVSDGGKVRSRSTLGTAWAWVRVENGTQRGWESGLLLPSHIQAKSVTNNNVELAALIEGIAHLPDGWQGHICSDSSCAMGWISEGNKLTNVPPPLRSRLKTVLQEAHRRGVRMTPVAMAGHPEPEDLAAGIRLSKAPHLPVSSWNVMCDKLCQKRARLFRLANPVGGKP